MSSRGAGKSAGNSVGRILSGASRGGVILDGPAFGVPALVAEEPDRILEGSWDDWRILDEEFAAGKNADVTDGGLAGWIDYEGNFRFGVFPQWRREPIDWPEAAAAASAQFRSGVSEAEWVERVQRTHEYIAAGDIYQVNLTHNLCAPWDSSPGEFYPHFRGAHPAPCSAYLSLRGTTVLSASPEVFLDISEGRIVTKPIKGTRARGADRLSDEAALRDLIGSAKERAELVMITDLLRNDLGQVCRYGSVNVPALCQPETFPHVHHLVSTVEGSMRPEVSPIAALRACFPGGSITGAPKKRAMQIIAELEKGPRGIYTGAIGFIDWKGHAVFSIAIRTLVIREGIATYGVGAGIVADSDPHREYEETMHKAAGLFAALAD